MTMWIPVNPIMPAETAAPHGEDAVDMKSKRKKRLGATAMEYLVCISFILLVVIFTVQNLGIKTGELFGKNANATNSTIKQ